MNYESCFLPSFVDLFVRHLLSLSRGNYSHNDIKMVLLILLPVLQLSLDLCFVGVVRAWAGPGTLAQPGSWEFRTPFVRVRVCEHLEVRVAKLQALKGCSMVIIFVYVIVRGGSWKRQQPYCWGGPKRWNPGHLASKKTQPPTQSNNLKLL